MTATLTPADDHVHPPALRRRTAAVAVAAAVVLVVVGLASFAAGRRSAEGHVTVLTGRFYVGDREASTGTGGSSYTAFETVGWTDARGSFHDSGWRDCMNKVGSTVAVRFGAMRVDETGDEPGFNNIVWVDCRSAVRIH